MTYATAPGNFVGDGEGPTGLYTENLLREIMAPEAKGEDVFKRVRLGFGWYKRQSVAVGTGR